MAEYHIFSEASLKDLGAVAGVLAQRGFTAHLNPKCLWWYDRYGTLQQIFPGDPHSFIVYETGCVRVNQGATDDI